MGSQLVPGYLRIGFQSDALAWSQRSLNLEQLYAANQACLQRKPDEAIRLFSVAVEPDRRDERLLYWCGLARLYALSNRSGSEDEAMEQAHLIKASCSASVKACYFLRLAVYQRSRGQNNDALQSALQAEALVMPHGNTVIRGFVASEVGVCLLRLGNVAGAAARMLQSFSKLRSHLAPMQLATLSIQLGAAYLRSEEYSKAVDTLSLLLEMQPDDIGVRNYIMASFTVATAEHQQMQYHTACLRYRKLLQDHTGRMDLDLRVQIATALASALCEIDELSEAEVLLHEYLDGINSLSNTNCVALLGTLGKLYACQLQFTKARRFYDQALDRVRENELTVRHRLLLEDYLNSGSITSSQQLVPLLRELAEVTKKQLKEESAAIVQLGTAHAAEFQAAVTLSQQRQAAELQLLSDAQDRVSSAIGSHLHSTTLQELMLLRIGMEDLQQRLVEQAASDDVVDSVKQLLARTTSIAEQVRDVSHVLHHHNVHGGNIVHAFQDYTEYMQRYAGGIAITFQHSGTPCYITDALARSMYRCAEICTQNAIRHSRCTSISLELQWSSDRLYLVCSDNGSGFDTQAIPEGMGLRELHARIRYASGILDISSSNTGTRVAASFPISRHNRQ